VSWYFNCPKGQVGSPKGQPCSLASSAPSLCIVAARWNWPGSPDPGLPAQQGAALTNAGSPPRQPQLSEARDVTNSNAAHKDVSAARGIATTRRRNSHFKKVSLLSGDVSSGDNRGSLILINPTPAVS
jgi:hypothetical protein